MAHYPIIGILMMEIQVQMKIQVIAILQMILSVFS